MLSSGLLQQPVWRIIQNMISPTAQTSILQRRRSLPTAELSRFIDNYLILESPAGGPLPRILPGAGAACFFNLGAPLQITDLHQPAEKTYTSAFLICNRRHVLELYSTGATQLIVVHFRPGRLRYFTDASFGELQDHITPATDLWGNRALEMIESLAATRSFPAKASVLSAFFGGLLQERNENRLDTLLDMLYLSPGTRIADIAEQSGLSLRHFERLFTATYGVTPKHFARIARMQQVARKLALDPAVGTLESALDAGFFDQSHFIHELRKLAGLSPTELAHGVRERPHFYNPKALHWYVGHIQRMVNGQEPGDPARAQTLMKELMARRTV